MGVADTLVGWAVGVLTALVGLWVYRHTVKRDAFQDHCSSYKERIAVREKAYEQAAEGPDKENKKDKLNELCDEYDQFLEAWQQKQELAKLVPPREITAERPKLSAEEIAQIVELLAGSTRLPAILLSADDYVTRGNAYYEAGDYQQALEAYNRALEISRDDPVPLTNRSATLHKLGRYQEALEDCNRALELSPEHPAALYNRGTLLSMMERYEEALDDYSRVLTILSDQPVVLNNRGSALTALGRCEEALMDYNRALELRPDATLARYNRARAYSLLGRPEESLQDLETAIKGDEKWRGMARTDEDFEKLRNDPGYGPRFRKLVGEQDHSEG